MKQVSKNEHHRISKRCDSVAPFLFEVPKLLKGEKPSHLLQLYLPNREELKQLIERQLLRDEEEE